MKRDVIKCYAMKYDAMKCDVRICAARKCDMMSSGYFCICFYLCVFASMVVCLYICLCYGQLYASVTSDLSALLYFTPPPKRTLRRRHAEGVRHNFPLTCTASIRLS